KNKVVRQPDNSSKLAVRLLAIGSTTAILPSAFTVAGTQTVAAILKFIMRKLGLETIHVYVLNSFQPTPDETMGQLHAMFSTNGVLNLSYCENIAFG
ncbi:autophagy protein 12, partial [Metschnikowia bicuspidata var. bicuspidata NRRL YB-4993]